MAWRIRIAAFRWWHEVLLLALLVGLLAAAGVLDPSFLRPTVQARLSTQVWELALLTLPMTLIIITAGIDLSVGAIMGLSAVVLGLSYEAGLSPWLGAPLAMVAGAGAGAVNGLFIARVKVHPLIVTLAGLAAFRGIAVGISLGRPISGFPDGFGAIGRGTVGGIPVPALVFVLLAVISAVYLGRSVGGRFIYAIGHNETAARFTGVPVDRIKFWLYTASGAVAGLAAVLYVSHRNTAKADIGTQWELDAITAVVMGGTSIYGGRGHIPGTLLGVLLIHETRKFVEWHWQRDELNLIVIGALLILSVLLHRFLRRQPHGN